jgi:hypothetical protein
VRHVWGSVLAHLITAAWLFTATAGPAYAHGFGQRYDLPLPLPLYLFGAAAVVALSFAVFGLFVRRAPAVHAYPCIDLLTTRLGRLIARPGVVVLVRLLGVALFAITILAGLIGDQNPYRNIAPTMVWIIWWVGLVYVSAFVGDVWALLNPWRTMFDAVGWLLSFPRTSLSVVMARRQAPAGPSSTPRPSRDGQTVPQSDTGTTGSPAFTGDDKTRGIASPAYLSAYALAQGRQADSPSFLPYPPALGVGPACALLLGFAWIELVYPNAAAPAHLAWFAIAYSLLTWTGMAVFGRKTWLEHGEAFTVVFGLFARFAPTEFRAEPRQLLLRPFGAGLVDGNPVPTSLMAFVLLLLATVLYDGFSATPAWSGLEAAFRAGLGANSAIPIRTAGLVAFWLLFLAAYLLVCKAMGAIVAGDRSALDIARSFALTLIPIAIGYHLAHYLAFLLVQGQYVIPLLSDPFGFGWNVFGTAGYRVDIGIVGARFAWYAALSAIVLGHVAAVYLGHVRAIQTFGTTRTALRSQVPLTALMVVYTFTGLSIIAGPIVEQGTPAQPTASASRTVDVPADAVLPEPGSGTLRAVGPDKLAGQRLTYRVLGSAFHDGTRVTAADLLYGYMFAYRWGVRADGSDRYDPVVDAATARLRDHLVALRFVGVDAGTKSFRVGDVDFVRELLMIDVYLALAPDDPEQDAVIAPPWSTLPWHLIVLMEEAVSRGWAAFSQGEATRRGTEWLDLVRSEGLKSRLMALRESFERDGFRPDSLQALVSVDEARKRWSALGAFHKSHGHFLVTNGPYRLKQWSETAATLEAFRDLTYPLGVGSYDAYAIPRRGFVTKVEASGARITLTGDIEIVNKFQRSFRLVRTPMQSIAADALRRADPQCRYVVMDERGRVVFAGHAGPADDATFRIDLVGRLAPGRYTMHALIAPNGNAMNADIRRIPVVIPAQP